MSTETISATDPAVVALKTANDDLIAKNGDVEELRSQLKQATAVRAASATGQRTAYTNLATRAQTLANGDPAFILGCGFEVAQGPAPLPPITDAPTQLTTSINGTTGRIVFGWSYVVGARNYQAQYTTDLSGATGWTDAPEMTGRTRLNVDGLTSGTKYALRVRACGNAAPGPWSVVIVQLAA